MKRILFIAVLALTTAASASAQMFDFSSNRRLDFGIIVGQAARTTPYERVGIGASLSAFGVYVDCLEASPQHRYDNSVSDTQWNDDMAIFVNAGYQIPVLRWLKVMHLVGYGQTNEGVTDASTINISDGEYSHSIYHDYNVTPGSRTHYFNYGGGISIQPCKWFCINGVYTRYAIYGGISLNLLALAGR